MALILAFNNSAFAGLAFIGVNSPSSIANADAPIVTLESGVNGCQGVLPTPGSENTNKRFISGSLQPGGTATFEISFPVDATDVAGRTTFVITDCVFIDGQAALKYSVSFVPNTENFVLTFTLTIPANAPLGGTYCNYAKTTAAPSQSQASNRKAGPACFVIGGDLRVLKVDNSTPGQPLPGAIFTVSCTAPNVPTGTFIQNTVITAGSSVQTITSPAPGSTHSVTVTTQADGVIAVSGAQGTSCTFTETTPPTGYSLADPASHTLLIGSAQLTYSFVDSRNKVQPSISTTPSAGGTIGVALTDTATLTGGFAPITGTVTFNLYAPGDTSCTTSIGSSAHAVSGGSASSGTATTGSYTTAAVGTYHWTAVYGGDANNLSATSGCALEPVTTTKAQPLITTSLSVESAAINALVHDSATLSGATSNAGGTVTYTAYNNSACTTGAQAAGVKSVTNGVVPDSNAISFASAGTYYWQAAYSGDANNASATSGCLTEILNVGKTTPTVSTTLSASSVTIGTAVHDSATLSGVTPTAGGTVTYSVYSDSSCATLLLALGTQTVANGLVPNSDPVTFDAAGAYYFQAAYSGDANNGAAASPCTSEQLTVAKNSPSIATSLTGGNQTGANITVPSGTTVADSATLSGATANAGGTVSYTAFTNSACTTGAQSAGATKAVTNGSVANSDPITFNTAGTFYWQAIYSGDANNNGSTSVCTAETVTVTAPPPPPPAPALGALLVTKYNDTNRNGTRDAGEAGLQGFVFTVKSGGVTVATLTSDANGTASAGNMPAGTYTITETQQTGWTSTDPGTSLTKTASVSVGQTTTVLFGNAAVQLPPTSAGTLVVTKYNDLNANKTRDTNEPALAGWTFTVKDASGATVGSVATDANGNAIFSNVAFGTYTVTETLQAGWTSTDPGGATPTKTVTINAANTTVLFGNAQIKLPNTSTAEAPASPSPAILFLLGVLLLQGLLITLVFRRWRND